MSDISLPHCKVCGRVEYDCICVEEELSRKDPAYTRLFEIIDKNWPKEDIEFKLPDLAPKMPEPLFPSKDSLNDDLENLTC